jgi:DNA modification methylase
MKIHSTKLAEACQAAADFHHPQIELVPIDLVRPYPLNARTHDERNLSVITASVRQFGFRTPIQIDANNVVVAGHGRLEAAKRLGMKSIPAIRITDLSPDDLRALRIADNRSAELAGWDDRILAIEFQHLCSIEVPFSVELTGFSHAEVDVRIENAAVSQEGEIDEDADIIPDLQETAVSRPGDLFVMGRHRLLCGSALDAGCFERLMGGEKATLICQDPPWNIAVKDISGSGRKKHREFIMASGEMTDAEFRQFILTELECNLAVVEPGAVFQVFIDWRGIEKVITAGVSLGLEHFGICIWNKGHGSFGSPWRSAHEMVVCFRVPGAPIKDRVKMGHYGRVRNNVWTVPGMGSFGKGRKEALEAHPTSKPVALLTEAIRDVTDRGDIVVDSFSGSGSCLIAAHKTDRVFRGLELDPLYVDTIVRRWQNYTGEAAILEGDGRTFAELEEERGAAEVEPAAAFEPVRQRVRLPASPFDLTANDRDADHGE